MPPQQQCVQLIAAPQCPVEHIEAAADMLHAQWPRGGSVTDYCKKLQGEGSPNTTQSLPCSFLLIQHDVVVGHGRLTECSEGAGESAAAATYVITEPRGRGFGTQLMTLLEQQTVVLGYHYLYLWTASAVPFYLKIGYSQTERVSLFSACLKTLECDQVCKLEEMIAKRAGHSIKKHETVMLPPDSASDNDVWLRKRLVESVGSVSIPLEQRTKEILAVIQPHQLQLAWQYCLICVPWQRQVGPSCGLAALRMLRDHYVTKGSKMPSLLTEAQNKDYSIDGEVFEANNLVRLARYCGLEAELWSFKATSPAYVLALLKAGGTLILPYDSQASTKQPCQNSGRTAHYGIIIGMLIGYTSYDLTPSFLNEHGDREVQETDTVLLLVQHSLSPKLVIASWTDFLVSNQQLVTIDEIKYKSHDAASLNLRDCLIVCHGSAGEEVQALASKV